MTEDQLQRAVAKVLDAFGLTWCHVPNGGKRSTITGAIMKAQGVKAGVPDVLIFDGPKMRDPYPGPIGFHRGLAIELKVGRNKPRPAQLEWHRRLARHDWRVEVCYTLDEVLRVLEKCYPDKFHAI